MRRALHHLASVRHAHLCPTPELGRAGMYVTLLQNTAQAYIQLEDWRMAAAFSVAAYRVDKRASPVKACMRAAMAFDRLGLQLAAS